MTTFEYLAVLFSVVVGLAITQTLRGLLRIVQHRKTVRVYWPPLIWTGAVLQWTILFWWFSGLDLAQLDEWRYTSLLFVLAYGSALYFLLGILHPDDVGKDFDMRRHFEENRVWFFGAFLCLGLLDVADTAYKFVNGVLTLPEDAVAMYVVFMSVWIVGATASLKVRDGRFIALVGIVYFLLASYLGLRTPVMGSDLVSASF